MGAMKILFDSGVWRTDAIRNFLATIQPTPTIVRFHINSYDKWEWTKMPSNEYFAENDRRSVSFMTFHALSEETPAPVVRREDSILFNSFEHRQDENALWEFYVWDDSYGLFISNLPVKLEVPSGWSIKKVQT